MPPRAEALPPGRLSALSLYPQSNWIEYVISVPSVSQDQQEGFTRLAVAESYLVALKSLLSNPSTTANDAALIQLPANMLAGFALELLLKGYLLLKGEASAAVRGYGHDIGRLVLEADARGLNNVIGLDELTRTLGSGHADFTYRYIEAGNIFDLFRWGKVLPIFDDLFQKIAEDMRVGRSS